ncbi:titin [Elysia marginata]|uniref:Titin n=1 Tax=Elysia marginata TaxID=1093978 RepID=A0AAV4GL17_9GAST|nr:titin [Elysia marginata]
MPSRVEREDLTADITEDQAHGMIGKHVNSFLSATFATSPDQKNNTLAELVQAFYDSRKTFQPFLDLRDLDRDGNFSQWTVLAQERFAEELANQVQIENEIVVTDGRFARIVPPVRIEGDQVIVETATFVDDGGIKLDLQPDKESPREIKMKLHTKDFIWAAVAKRDNQLDVNGPKNSLIGQQETCRSLNEYALDIALKQSRPSAQYRYKNQGRPIILEDDDKKWFYFQWASKPLVLKEDARGLHVKAITFTDAKRGEHFCKVMSPYRAMEWINIDSLRKF